MLSFDCCCFLFPFSYNFLIFLKIVPLSGVYCCVTRWESCFSYSVSVVKILKFRCVSFTRLLLLVKKVWLLSVCRRIWIKQPLALFRENLCAFLCSFWWISHLVLYFTYLFHLSFHTYNASFMIQVIVIIRQRDRKDKIIFCIWHKIKKEIL